MKKILYFFGSIIFWIKHYFIQIVLLFILLSASFFIFREFYYFGTLKLYLSNQDTKIYINDKYKKTCKTYYCEFTIPKGEYNLKITKDGFYTYLDILDIKFNKVLEKSIILKKNSTNLKWIKDKINKQIISFPIENYYTEETIPFLNITKENILQFKSNDIVKLDQKVYISSDQLGRNAWIISNKEINKFDFYKKNFFPILQRDITGFKALKDGSFLWANNEKEIFHFKDQTSKILDIQSENINNICLLTNGNFVYLKKHEDGTSFMIYNNKKNNEKTVITNLFPYEISFIECSNSNFIKGMLKSGKIFLLDF
jgi:hypothetical protein